MATTQTVIEETITRFTCVDTTLLYMNEAGELQEFDLADKIPAFQETPDVLTVLGFNRATKVLSYKDEEGKTVTHDLSECFPASTFSYDPATHTVTHNGKTHLLKKGSLVVSPDRCSIIYTNECGEQTEYLPPTERLLYSADGCSATFLPIKGDAITFPTGVPATQVGLSLVDKSLVLTYKDKKCCVPMPNSIIGCAFDAGANRLRFMYCDGTSESKDLPKATLQKVVLDDGTQVMTFNDGCGNVETFNVPQIVINMDEDGLTVADSVLTFTFGGDGNDAVVNVDICKIVATNCNATITAQRPDGGFDFRDNAGQVFSVPGHVAPEVVQAPGSDVSVLPTVGPAGQIIYTISYTAPPLPAVEAAGDNVTVTPSTNADGATVYTVQVDAPDIPPPCCTYPTASVVTLTEDKVPAVTGAPTTKALGDTVLQKHPNGFSVFLCDAQGWKYQWQCITPDVPEFPATQLCCTYLSQSLAPLVDGVRPAAVDPVTEKNPGDTLIQKHPNGFTTFVCSASEWRFQWQCITPEEAQPPAGEVFGPGDILPADADEVMVCVEVDGDRSLVTVGGADQLPQAMLGAVIVDEATGAAVYVPPKADRVALVNGANEPLTPDQGEGNDAFCVQEPLTRCDPATGETVPVPKGHRVRTYDERQAYRSRASVFVPALSNAGADNAMDGFGQAAFQTYFTLSYTITNPSLCDQAVVYADLRQGNIQMNLAPGDTYQVRYTASAPNTFAQPSIVGDNFYGAAADATHDNKALYFPPGNEHFTRVLDPGETFTVEYDIEIRASQKNSPPGSFMFLGFANHYLDVIMVLR